MSDDVLAEPVPRRVVSITRNSSQEEIAEAMADLVLVGATSPENVATWPALMRRRTRAELSAKAKRHEGTRRRGLAEPPVREESDLPSAEHIATMAPDDRRVARAGLLYAARVEAASAEVFHLPAAGVGLDEPLPVAPDDWDDGPPAGAYRLTNIILGRVVEIGRALRAAAAAALRSLAELAAAKRRRHAAALRALVRLATGNLAGDEHGRAPPPLRLLADDIARHGPPGLAVAPPSIGAGPARAA